MDAVSGAVDEAFCPLCHPERLPTEARLAQPAHAGHIGIRFDMNAHWLVPVLNGRSIGDECVDEVVCGDNGWALCIVMAPAKTRFYRTSVLCHEHPNEPLRRVLRGQVSVTRAYETSHAN